jgi:hypothetical protein
MAKAPKASLLALVLTLLACAWSAVPAFGSAKDVIKDCSEDGILNGHYSHSELAKALAQLPAHPSRTPGSERTCPRWCSCCCSRWRAR